MLLNCGVGEDSWVPFTARRSSQSILKEISPEYSFIGRIDVEAETPILWPLDAKNWLIGKHPDAGKDWRWEEKGMTENEMIGWYHQLDGHEFEQALGVGNGKGSLACCSPWGHKESDMTEWLNWTELRMSPGNRITQVHGKSYSMNMSFSCFSSFQLFGNKISYLKFLGLPHAGTFF